MFKKHSRPVIAWGAAPLLVLLALLGTGAAETPEGKPLFIELPPGVIPNDVGANGFVVVGSFFTGGAFYWMPTTGVVSIGGTYGEGVSRDGKTIVGRALDAQRRENAAIWMGGTEWRLLGSFAPDAQSCDKNLSGTYSLNDESAGDFCDPFGFCSSTLHQAEFMSGLVLRF